MEGGSIVGKLTQHDAEIDEEAAEHADAETSDGAWRRFGEVCGCHHGGLTDSQAHHKSPSKDLAVVSVGGNVDNNANNPDGAKLSCSPETSQSIGCNERN